MAINNFQFGAKFPLSIMRTGVVSTGTKLQGAF